MKLRLLAGLCLALSGSLTALPSVAAPRKPAAAEAPAEARLGSELGAERKAALSALVEAFNAQEKGGRIMLEDGEEAEMMILGSRSEEALLNNPGRFVPLHAVMKAAGVPFDVTRAVPGVTPPVLQDKSGKLLALPVALETPILFANDKVLRKAGLDGTPLPRTWASLQEALGKLADAGVICPFTVARPAETLLENQAAWHNVAYASPDGMSLAVNGLGEVRHLARMASWQKSRYLQVFGHGDEAVAHFAAGECGYLAAGQAAMPQFMEKQMSVRVGSLPHYDDVPGAPQNTLADGDSLWVSAKTSAAQKKLIARFVRFWTEPAQQISWQKSSGFLPINRAGAFAATSQTLGPELEHVGVAIGQLANKPVTANSRASTVGHSAAVREILESELDAVWQEGRAAKLALDNAVARSRGACGICAAAAKGKAGK
ncbi:extracellular solute-binding protein [Niveibacterium sp. SC-1]|uniref:extracellular solute-binding protein n=1 Tax=Niveibacterium sp. SC-1 TaxID=3135646 RepID=UPI00311D9391